MTDLPLIEEIFDEAMAIAAPKDREEFLANRCPSADIRKQVERLLAAQRQAESFLQTPPGGTSTEVVNRVDPFLGSQIGPYKIRERIGEGGMGMVYVAEQQRPVRRKVALKIIKPSLNTREVISRFEAERQALASMQHPNIATVLDVGVTDQGAPYLAMELVRGIPIGQYCDEARFSTRERLALFQDVCAAVQHAHQKGIIHRDLKPSNVLVTEINGKPTVKVIDFGLAKAADGQRLTERTLYTGFMRVMGTPTYMSPEQAGLCGQDVDTRSDVYSLGVLLYEIITGTTPLDASSLGGRDFEQIFREIRESDSPKPSQRISSLDQEQLTTAAKRRRATVDQLRHELKGDLDRVVLKALDKDRDRRYQTPQELAADMERYLAGAPVHAVPPSPIYVLRKFVRRHAAYIAAASTIVVLLVTGTVISTVLALRAVRAERRAVAAQQHAVGEQRRAERLLYAANMNLVQAAFEKHNFPRVSQLLEETFSHPDRGFEWYYWQREMHRERAVFRGHGTTVTKAAFAPVGPLMASGDADGIVKVWNRDTLEVRHSLKVFGGVIGALEFSPDGAQLIISERFHWSPQWRMVVVELATERVLADLVAFCGTYSPDGKALVLSAATGVEPRDRQEVSVWNAATGEQKYTPLDKTYVSYDIAVSADSEQVAFSSKWGYGPRLWDLATGQSQDLPYPEEVDGGVYAIDFSPDGRYLLAGSRDQTVRLWDVAELREIRKFRGHTDVVHVARFSPDGRHLVTAGGDGTVRIWDIKTESGPQEFSKASTGHAVSSPDGRLLLSADQVNATFWNVETGETFHTFDFSPELLPFDSGRVPHAQFSPDGKQVAILTHHAGHRADQTPGALTLSLWNLSSGTRQRERTEAPPASEYFSFSPDGRMIVWPVWPDNDAGGAVMLLDADSLEVVKVLPHDTGRVGECIYSPDGKYLVSAAESANDLQQDDTRKGGIRVWDAKTYELLRQIGDDEGVLQGPQRVSPSVAFSPEGTLLAAEVGLGEVAVYDFTTGERNATMSGHKEEVTSIRFSHDGSRLITASHDGTARLWDVERGRQLLTLNTGAASATSAGFFPDGLRVFTSGFPGASSAPGLAVWRAAAEADVRRWREQERAHQVAPRNIWY